MSTSLPPGPFDVAIVGGGPGGYATAFFARSLGLSPIVVERHRVGGTCLHRGCIPAKTWLHAAETFATVAEGETFGVRASGVTIDWQLALKRKEQVVASLFDGLERAFRQREIPVVNGIGRIQSPNEVLIRDSEGTHVVAARTVVVATGSRPQTIPGFDLDGKRIVSSDHALDWNQRPDGVVIIGAGAIGCEFASMLSDLGSEVTVIELMDQVVPGIDRDAARELQTRLRRRGVRFHLGISAGAPIEDAGAMRVAVGETYVRADVILMAVGRIPNTEDLGLGEIGVTLERGHVKVDPATMQTDIPNVFAVGDIVAGAPQLAHAAFVEGLTAARFIATGDRTPVDQRSIPLVVYTRPEVAQIGLTEEMARDSGVEVVVHQRPFGGGGRALIKGEKRGLVKLVIDESNRLIGASIVGPQAGELIHELMVTMGTGMDVLDAGRLIHAHPTLSETVGETLLAASGTPLH